MVFDIGVSMAYQLSDNVAFGIGVDYMTATIELTRNVGLINPFNQRLTDVAEVRLKSDGINSAWAWNAGLLWKIGAGFTFGASYRSEFTITGEGTGKFSQMPTGYPEFDAVLGTFLPFDENLPITASFAFPDFWNVGLSWQNEKWTLSGQYGVMGWSAYQELPIIFPENPEFRAISSTKQDSRLNRCRRFLVTVTVPPTPGASATTPTGSASTWVLSMSRPKPAPPEATRTTALKGPTRATHRSST